MQHLASLAAETLIMRGKTLNTKNEEHAILPNEAVLVAFNKEQQLE